MCGRFIFIPIDELTEILRDVEQNITAQAHANVLAEHHDVYPQSDVPILVPNHNRLETAVMQWGFPVSWQKAPLFNTRAETAAGPKKNMWSESLHERRCIIPAYGFYEPHKTERAISEKTGKEIKQQYLFTMPETGILFMAGVHDGDNHFSIMTTTPNEWVEPVHNRMPVVLLQSELHNWLSDDYLSLFDRGKITLRCKAYT